MTETNEHSGASWRRNLALENEILRGVVGSTSYGAAIAGQDDRDEMGVCMEPPEYVCGLSQFEHYIYRDQPEGVRSQPGDLDLTIYALRKFCRLAAQGNPSVLVLLWLPTHLIKTELGRGLLDIREAFVSREAGWRFLGYLSGQKQSLTGQRSQKVQRPELVEKYGFDTKFAMHALRLGFEGIEYMTERRLTLPVPEPYLTTLRAVRGGQVSLEATLTLIEETEARLRALVERCKIAADVKRINRFMVEASLAHWRR